jgi:YfiH family protein
MRFADCAPILLHDPAKGVVGLVHSGWLGTVRGAVRAAVEAMQTRYGTIPADILAAIGPSIGPDHYEVGEDVMTRLRGAFGAIAETLLESHGGGIHLNLWEANRLLLEQTGVKQIEIAGLCTACRPSDWFSHRAQKGKTGRFGALIALQS